MAEELKIGEQSKPRFEFRSFGQCFCEAHKRMARLSVPVPEKVWERESDEIYIISAKNDINNTKIRNGKMDIKTYVQTVDGLNIGLDVHLSVPDLGVVDVVLGGDDVDLVALALPYLFRYGNGETCHSLMLLAEALAEAAEFEARLALLANLEFCHGLFLRDGCRNNGCAGVGLAEGFAQNGPGVAMVGGAGERTGYFGKSLFCVEP